MHDIFTVIFFNFHCGFFLSARCVLSAEKSWSVAGNTIFYKVIKANYSLGQTINE
jgi:hypothetical protein